MQSDKRANFCQFSELDRGRIVVLRGPAIAIRSNRNLITVVFYCRACFQEDQGVQGVGRQPKTSELRNRLQFQHDRT